MITNVYGSSCKVLVVLYTKTLHHHTHTHISTRRQQTTPTPNNPPGEERKCNQGPPETTNQSTAQKNPTNT